MDGIAVYRSRVLASSIAPFPLISHRPLRRISFLRFPTIATEPSQPAQTTKPQKSPKPAKRQSSSPAAATDGHLSSILQHPLFSVSPLEPATTGERSGNGSNIKKEIRNAPLAVLDRLMASGQADHRVLFLCLRSHLSKCDQTDNKSRSKAASRILSWYAAADERSRFAFFSNRKVMHVVMSCMVSAGRQETVMAWLSYLCDFGDGGARFGMVLEFSFLHPDQDLLRNLMRELMDAESQYGSVETAIGCFLRCYKMIFVEGDKFGARERARFWLKPAGANLAGAIALRGRSAEVRSIPVPLFDALIDTFSVINHYWGCRLRLFHPRTPQIDRAESFLKSQVAEGTWRGKIRIRHVLRHLCLDALELCVEQGEFTKANQLVSLAKPLFTEDNVEHNPSSQASSALDMLSQMHAPVLASQ